MEWIRKLGIRIWFLEKPQQRFENIFEKFQGNEAKRSPDILSGWNLNSIDKAIADLKSRNDNPFFLTDLMHLI